MNMKIALIPGDGIGPEVTEQAVMLLKRVGELYKHKIDFTTHLAGGAAIDATGRALPKKRRMPVKRSDAVLLGAVGGPKWDTLPVD